MSSEMILTVERTSTDAVIRLKGDLTTFAEDRVEAAVATLIQEGCRHCILDFSEVEYINSPGIAILIQVVSAMQEKDGRISAFGLNDHYRKIFRMVGLTEYIEIGETLEALRKSHGQP